MPTSHPKIISPVCTKILDTKPERVLDIGIGYGKWGTLTREYTDIWWWRFYKEEWKVTIDGIEVFERYRSHNWNAYNNIHIGKAEDILSLMPADHYDLITMMECLEHIEKPAAIKTLSHIMRLAPKAIVSYTNTHQKDVRDNEHEDHVSQWEKSELEVFGNIETLYEDSDGAVLFLTRKN